MSKEVGAYIKSGAIFKSVKRVRELMKCELCFNELSQNRHLHTTQVQSNYEQDRDYSLPTLKLCGGVKKVSLATSSKLR